MDLDTKEAIEVNYWKESSFESPDKFTNRNRHSKRKECEHLHYKVKKHLDLIRDKKRVLEIGAGQGWASCFLKRFYLKKAHFTVTDISEYAIESLKYWEKDFEVKIDDRFAAKSYEIKAPDNTFDLIFCYAAAHHFVEHKKTLKELKRLLRVNGKIIFLYEPTSSRLFYPLHHWLVNRQEDITPEDVLIPNEIRKLANQVGLNYTNIYDPHQTIVRSKISHNYYRILKTVSILNNWLPSSSDLVFEHK